MERVRDSHPAGEDWRADALAKSRHTRLLDELRAPLEDHDPERAETLCAEICRLALRDLAPALILLPAAERRRVQTLTALALTLFDFANQTGLEGERLAQINRLEFNLELALEGRPPGQPVWVRLAAEHEGSPWSEEALTGVVNAARARITRPVVPGGGRAVDEVRREAAALIAPLLEGELEVELVELAAGLLRLRALEYRDSRSASSLPPGVLLSEEAIRQERAALRVIFAGGRRTARLAPGPYRRAVRFLALAATRLVDRIEAAPAGETATLGGWTRLALLLRSRFG